MPVQGERPSLLVLVTRPREQAATTARLLETMGHRVLIDPVLEIRPVPLPAFELAGVAAVALTSANAAHALAGIDAALPVYAVGGATAAAARANGAGRLRVAGGDGAALVELIVRQLTPSAGAILHLAGAEVREELAEALADAGFTYRRATVYAAMPADGLADATRDALAAGRLDAVLLFSPRSAALWAGLVREAGLAGAVRRIVAVCLSEAVAAALAPLAFKEVRIAAARDQKALLRCLEAAP